MDVIQHTELDRKINWSICSGIVWLYAFSLVQIRPPLQKNPWISDLAINIVASKYELYVLTLNSPLSPGVSCHVPFSPFYDNSFISFRHCNWLLPHNLAWRTSNSILSLWELFLCHHVHIAFVIFYRIFF